MPFIGKDWRSPGEAWVKTESLGWQRMKIIESQLHPNCHQAHPACSWPPRAQFGQHMANNCSGNINTDSPDRASSSGEPSDECRNNNIRKRNSGHSESLSGSSCSPDSSCSNSASTSPTGSPEKNNPSSATHHLHPITISSPYGQYTCCAHHYAHDYSLSPCSSPRSSNRAASNYTYENSCDSRMSKSLSRESIQPQNRSSRTMGDKSTHGMVLRHNSSYSELKDHKRTPENNPIGGSRAVEQPTPEAMNMDDHIGQQQNHVGSVHRQDADETEPVDEKAAPGAPILMRNGLRISCDKEIVDKSFRQRTDKDDALVDEKWRQSPSDHPIGSVCCCCCCCGTSNHQQQHSCPHYFLKEQQPKTAPHCRISVRTREVAMYNTISEAFYRLDFCNAIHDIRRFNYICKLLHLLITQNLTSLSGCATKVVFTMLEQVAWEVSSNKRNIHVLKNLLAELKQMIQKYYCWGRPIGSSLLWQQHFETIDRISQIVDGIELSPPKTNNDNEMTFDQLPVEMIREILLRLNDYRDLVNSAQATPLMRSMIDSQNIWQKLCRYHFTDQQLRFVLESNKLGKSGNNNKQTLRGIKYARTTSADGQSSFRNPVRVARQQQRINQQQQQQTQQAANNKLNQARQASNSRRGSAVSSSSYVTKAIRIFDRKSSVPDVVASTSRQARQSSENIRSIGAVDRKSDTSKATHSHQRDTTTGNETASRVHHQSSSSSEAATNRIDWEHVFHQLRKRFDLKEEYADCLLLCRHCRCLFWKSFGHPCIKGAAEADKHFQANSRQAPVSNSRRASSASRSAASNEMNSNENYHSQTSHHRSPSVALLSRNFDHNATSSTQRNSSHMDGSSILPQAAVQNQSNLGHHQPSQQQRNPLEELNARFQARQQVVMNNLRHNNGGQQSRNNNDTNNSNVSNGASTIKRELVPQHVTITPQAFLKFFSL